MTEDAYRAIPLAGEALIDPEKWDREWETMLRSPHLSGPNGPPFCFKHILTQHRTRPGYTAHGLAAYPTLLSSTCAMQRNMTQDALSYIASQNLDEQWMDASPDERRKHILGAMASVCSKARNLNEARAYCVPELRLSRLRLNGKIFLDLLRSAMIDDITYIPNKPRYISHSMWDSFAPEQEARNTTDEEKLALAELMVLRTKLICYVLHFTLRSFLGLEPPPLQLIKTDHKPEKIDPDTKAMHETIQKHAFGPEEAKKRRQLEVSSAKARISQRLGSCSYMGCHQMEVEGGRKFSRCGACFVKLERQVLYCSQKCQKADWKLRHKAVCGKPLTFDDISTLPEHPANKRGDVSKPEKPADNFFANWDLESGVISLKFPL
ncbi:hypothetical protein FB45DRAFT_1007652 [Roridomyces roridus]|uniref:MYND-type domain-containing protein n=1 Tax=Roridomyces roridus TaxID=1738132 RepID=A0AAD7FG44_9AGAR|nr:hypothetical protein FB45DRAFT_1007652 [Roridomyces roridus]